MSRNTVKSTFRKEYIMCCVCY